MSAERVSYPTIPSQFSAWPETTLSASQANSIAQLVGGITRRVRASPCEFANTFTTTELPIRPRALPLTKLGLPQAFYLPKEPECVASSFVGGTFGFLATIYALNTDSDRAKQIKVIYRRLGDALYAGQFRFVEQIFEDTDVWRIHISASLSILTVTLRWRDELKRRVYFYHSVSSRIKADPSYRNHHDGYLRGLK